MKMIAGGVATAGMAAALFFGSILFMGASSTNGGSTSQAPPSVLALKTIPASYRAAYQHAATLCPGLSWTVLAAIGEVETNQGGGGTNPAQTSPAGAEGPMQFMPATFAAYRLPDEDDINSIQDAADTAARFLCANGASNPATLSEAIFAYNHLASYVADVLSWAARYASDAVVASATTAEVVAATTLSGITVMPPTPVEPGAPYPTSGFPFGQCTWWAALNVPVSWSGNAWQWWANSPASRHSATPAPGDIVVYGPDYPGSNGYGHVAVVIGAQSADRFEVSEMNELGLSIVDERASDASYVEGFITA
ncbi:MAG: CHAP domain-containing protein [Nocardiopsaceae bacterium]|jgi:surface antigen|nr:CHAP domain-containing protein [Nocardiopsaceae bacterium]